MNTEEFIEKATIINGDKYDYSKVVFKKVKDKIIIICDKHGEFKQTVQAHLSGRQCKYCRNKNVKHTKETFIQKAITIHVDKYDYSQVDYTNNKTAVMIICKEHGIFLQIPNHHMNGSGCSQCNGGIRLTKEDFINKATIINGDKFDYSKVVYINNHSDVEIYCKEHNKWFFKIPKSHFDGVGCDECTSDKKKLKYDEVIDRFHETHGEKYIYDIVPLKLSSDINIEIFCKIHNEYFTQNLDSHLQGKGCIKCGRDTIRKSLSGNKYEFVEKAREIHGQLYKYDKVEYINRYTKVIVSCKLHSDFLVKPGEHLYNTSGCPICNKSHGEILIKTFLDKYNINYESEKAFEGCKFINYLRFDYYLSEYNLCIEHDGIQHFESIEYYGGDEAFEQIKINDAIKNKYCLDNNINLFRIRYDENIVDKLNEWFKIKKES